MDVVVTKFYLGFCPRYYTECSESLEVTGIAFITLYALYILSRTLCIFWAALLVCNYLPKAISQSIIAYTRAFKNPQNANSMGLRAGDHRAIFNL
jgi:hypothetical protein